MSLAARLRTTADALEADARERAASLRAAADEIEHAGGDELLDAAAVEARYPFRFRVVTDAARRGEITIEHAGRKPVVRRAALEAWIASRPVQPRADHHVDDERAEARASVAAAAKRIGGGK